MGTGSPTELCVVVLPCSVGLADSHHSPACRQWISIGFVSEEGDELLGLLLHEHVMVRLLRAHVIVVGRPGLLFPPRALVFLALDGLVLVCLDTDVPFARRRLVTTTSGSSVNLAACLRLRDDEAHAGAFTTAATTDGELGAIARSQEKRWGGV